MSFSNINRKIIEPSIISKRKTKRAENNVWNYVTSINKQLTENKIMVDNSMKVTAYFIVADNMIEQITELYEEAGWDVTDVLFTEPSGTDPGSTVITFKVPPA